MIHILASSFLPTLEREALVGPAVKVRGNVTDTYVDVYHYLEDMGELEILNLESDSYLDRFKVTFRMIGA